MKKIFFLPLVLLVLFITSCDSGHVYKKFKQNFPDYRWEKVNVLEYTPKITDTTSKYQQILTFRHIYGIPYEAVEVNVEITTPSGEVSDKNYILQLYDGKTELSECAGDYCDLETVIEDNYTFPETGTYKFKISQVTNKDPLQFVMEVGLIIDKIETDTK